MAKNKHKNTKNTKNRKKPTSRKKIEVRRSEDNKEERLLRAEVYLELYDQDGQVERLLDSEDMKRMFHQAFERYRREMQKAVNKMPSTNISVAQSMMNELFKKDDYEQRYIAELVDQLKINICLFCKYNKRIPDEKSDADELKNMLQAIANELSQSLIKGFEKQVLNHIQANKMKADLLRWMRNR